MRTIKWTISGSNEEPMTILPAAPQPVGVQGDDNAVSIAFQYGAQTMFAEEGITLYIEFLSSTGEYDRSEALESEGDNEVEMLLPVAWTQYGATGYLRLVGERTAEDDPENLLVFSPQAVIAFDNRAEAVQEIDRVLDGYIQRAVDAAQESADEAEQSAESAAGSATAAEAAAQRAEAAMDDKADLVDGAVAGNLAGLDANGNLTDSGIDPDELVTSGDYAPTAKTAAMTQPVGKDSSGALWTTPGGGGAVSSVNGKTGDVMLDAEDVGALPDDTEIPTKTSDLTNDGADGTHPFLSSHQDVSVKADKVSGATAGNLAGLDANGNLTDARIKYYFDQSNPQYSGFGEYGRNKAFFRYDRTGDNNVTLHGASLVILSVGQPESGGALTLDDTGAHVRKPGESAKSVITSADYAPTAKTAAMTQPVGKDSSGALWTTPGGGGAVSSVNGKIGDVMLDAEDVGALPDDTEIPTKTSDLINDGADGTHPFLSSHQDVSVKADKVSGATAGNLAGLDANGNLTDSGIKVQVESQGGKVLLPSGRGDYIGLPTAGRRWDTVYADYLDGDGSRINGVKHQKIKSIMDQVAENDTLYLLTGDQSSVTITLPTVHSLGSEISVVWYNGATPATFSISGSVLGDAYTPSASSRSEINLLWDGTNWSMLSCEQEVS